MDRQKHKSGEIAPCGFYLCVFCLVSALNPSIKEKEQAQLTPEARTWSVPPPLSLMGSFIYTANFRLQQEVGLSLRECSVPWDHCVVILILPNGWSVLGVLAKGLFVNSNLLISSLQINYNYLQLGFYGESGSALSSGPAFYFVSLTHGMGKIFHLSCAAQ